MKSRAKHCMLYKNLGCTNFMQSIAMLGLEDGSDLSTLYWHIEHLARAARWKYTEGWEVSQATHLFTRLHSFHSSNPVGWMPCRMSTCEDGCQVESEAINVVLLHKYSTTVGSTNSFFPMNEDTSFHSLRVNIMGTKQIISYSH